MKKKIYVLAAVVLAILGIGCKKFLNVTPIDSLSGNNYWKSKQDVEYFINGLYAILRDKIAGSEGNRRVFIPALEMRGNFVETLQGDPDGLGDLSAFNKLTSNDMKGINSGNTASDQAVKNIMNWDTFYQLIQQANIMYYEVNKMPSGTLTTTERSTYMAEAVFLRNLCYMYICKIFGDPIYYTEAYQAKPQARMPMVEALKRCIADMDAVKENLPVRYSNQTSNGFRPNRGAGITLLLHLNMWAAAFDANDKNTYYQAAKTLGEELLTYSEYQLLPVNEDNTRLIFKGRTAENFFGLLQEISYSETFAYASSYNYFFAHTPYRGLSTQNKSLMCYSKKYITTLFPLAVPDARLAAWFENYDAESGDFQFKKYVNTITRGSNPYARSNDSAIIFRLPDALLLVAEALAELGDYEGARTYVNKVRLAATAPPIIESGDGLKKEIFNERCRELIGEGHFFFDLVRTKRYAELEFTKTPIPVPDFNAGAWTWPLNISSAEKTNNPYLVGNIFWN